MKQQNSKLHASNKPRYISKAERAKIEAENAANAESETTTVVDNASVEDQAIEDQAVESVQTEEKLPE